MRTTVMFVQKLMSRHLVDWTLVWKYHHRFFFLLFSQQVDTVFSWNFHRCIFYCIALDNCAIKLVNQHFLGINQSAPLPVILIFWGQQYQRTNGMLRTCSNVSWPHTHLSSLLTSQFQHYAPAALINLLQTNKQPLSRLQENNMTMMMGGGRRVVVGHMTVQLTWHLLRHLWVTCGEGMTPMDKMERSRMNPCMPRKLSHLFWTFKGFL